MAEYIKRTDAVKIAEKYGLANGSVLGRHTGLADCIARDISELPAADVVPVRHGRWVEKEKYTFGIMYDCSLCEDRILDNGHPWNYCPNCGAKMDGGDDNSAICSKTI